MASVKTRSPAKSEPELLPLVDTAAASASKARPGAQLATSFSPGAKAGTAAGRLRKQLATLAALALLSANLWWAGSWLCSNSYNWGNKTLLQIATSSPHSRDSCSQVRGGATGCASKL